MSGPIGTLLGVGPENPVQFADPTLEARAVLMGETIRLPRTLGVAALQVASASGAPVVIDEPMRLAPMFARCICSVIDGMIDRGFDPHVYESERTDALQKHYYAQGRDRAGPIVTNARTAQHSMHGFRLAADIISRSKQWAAPMAFWEALGQEAERVGLVWGGRWTSPRDYPHVQWGTRASSVAVPVSPTDEMRAILAGPNGIMGVWRALGAV
jgi:hypothetical protein